MENKYIINSLRRDFFGPFKQYEHFIEICPTDLWNKKIFIPGNYDDVLFWQFLYCEFMYIINHLKDVENPSANGELDTREKIYLSAYYDPEKYLSREDLKDICKEAEIVANEWFNGKDDNWIKSSSKQNQETTNFTLTMAFIKKMTYYIGWCGALFKEYGVVIGEFYEYM